MKKQEPHGFSRGSISDTVTRTSVERLSSFYAKRGKYLFDFVAAFFLILMFSPLMILIAILIKLSSRGPVFFLIRE